MRQLGRERLQPIFPARDDQDAPAVAVEPPRGRLADAARRTGDDGGPHRASTLSTSAAVSRAMRERGTTTSKPASSARRRVSTSVWR